MKSVLVTGASGFVGSHLCQALIEAGHDVRAMTRRPEDYRGPELRLRAMCRTRKVCDPRCRASTWRGYYLVHSLDDDDFVEKDAAAARAFSAAAAENGTRTDHLPRRPGPRR